MPLGPRCGSKPAGSAENAAIRVPPGLAAAEAERPHGAAAVNAAAAVRPTLKRRRETDGTLPATMRSEYAILHSSLSCLPLCAAAYTVSKHAAPGERQRGGDALCGGLNCWTRAVISANAGTYKLRRCSWSPAFGK